ncbi:hypothetical protein AOXY_G18628 [Acipenser oxyrinchus oxyrinchus]|uniref:Uncharacterized protein n=1 Tax=Acipenser oxyrinchus oxyrinchus TaxID=40147 RepID=A0AAD8D4P8_ACIOX|nr:hypothetical protein AOXY_G18628 [Acipenser oxyrinchus oxyrinchus]
MLDEKCTMTCRNLEQDSWKLIQDFLSVGKESPEYLNHVSKQVDKYRHQTVPLKKPTEYPLRIGGLNDTIYEEMEEELEAWENFYMPDRVEMKVIGAIDTFPSLAVGLQLIILAGKDGNIYAYENEVLHQVADCLQDLIENGLAFPGTKIYNYGECFDPMTDDEYSELMQSEEVKRMEDETRELIQSNEDEFLRILARIEEKENAEKVVSNKVVPCNDHSKCAHELTINYFSDLDFRTVLSVLTKVIQEQRLNDEEVTSLLNDKKPVREYERSRAVTKFHSPLIMSSTLLRYLLHFTPLLPKQFPAPRSRKNRHAQLRSRDIKKNK